MFREYFNELVDIRVDELSQMKRRMRRVNKQK